MEFVVFCSELEVIYNKGALEERAPPVPEAAVVCSGLLGAARCWRGRVLEASVAAPVQRNVQPRHFSKPNPEALSVMPAGCPRGNRGGGRGRTLGPPSRVLDFNRP